MTNSHGISKKLREEDQAAEALHERPRMTRREYEFYLFHQTPDPEFDSFSCRLLTKIVTQLLRRGDRVDWNFVSRFLKLSFSNVAPNRRADDDARDLASRILQIYKRDKSMKTAHAECSNPCALCYNVKAR